MIEYEYEKGKTYLSSSNPIMISKIPRGTYTIKVNKGSYNGKLVFDTEPGAQVVDVTAYYGDWDFSNMDVYYHSGNIYWGASGIKAATPALSYVRVKFTSGDTVIEVGPDKMYWASHVGGDQIKIHAPTVVPSGSIRSGDFEIEFFDADGNSLGIGYDHWDGEGMS